jgi:hypothetical protein
MMVVEIKTSGNMLNITSSEGGYKGGSNGDYNNGVNIGSRSFLDFGDDDEEE